MLTYIVPSRHVVRDTPTARLFRKMLRFPDIFTFWNAETGQWVLAYWITKKLRLCEEVEDLGMAFEKVTPEFVQMIVSCWKAVDWKAKKQRLLSKEKDRIRIENDKLVDQNERWTWAQKKLVGRNLKPVPYAFSSPVSGGEVL